MGFHQYYKPPEELSNETRTFTLITSVIEEAGAISWYEKRMLIEQIRSQGYYANCPAKMKNKTFRCAPGILTSNKTVMENYLKNGFF